MHWWGEWGRGKCGRGGEGGGGSVVGEARDGQFVSIQVIKR